MSNLLFEEKLLTLRNNRDLSVFDILSIDDLNLDDINLILEISKIMKESSTEKLSLLKGVTIVNAFYENSTRTRTSFEMAGKHLGADTINISGSSSSTKKGESLIDTTQTLASYNAQTLIIRSQYSGIPYQLSKYVKSAVINAGDGWHEHPSQGLLDAKTILDYYGDFNNKTITVVGDVIHSRVFGSLVRIIKKLGGNVRVACPKTFIPENIEELFDIKVFYSLEDALEGTDVIYALRVQEERGSTGFIPSMREYSKTFGINKKRLSLANKNAILMHAGPVIRDIDINSDLVTMNNQSKILTQVENGMAIRASLQWLVSKRLDGKVKPYDLI
jgi:aspartate carbamoyltransferase catalytic subunit